MTLSQAIRRANAVLPGEPAPDGELDPRWQAIIEVANFIETHPDEVWDFVAEWGGHEQDDLRMAIATCLLEHLLEHHFEAIFPRVEKAARSNRLFADTFCSCWKFGPSEHPENARRWDRLRTEIAGRGGSLS